jgi:hypothetical protein
MYIGNVQKSKNVEAEGKDMTAYIQFANGH